MKRVIDTDYEKWARYYFFFYLNEEMTFGDFISSVKRGYVPRRGNTDWDKVVAVKDQVQL
jgi:hypothetical protein